MVFHKKDKWMGKHVGVELLTIESVSMEPSKHAVTSSAAPVLICSYNWRELQKPVIYVPGSAASWIDKTLPFTIPPDSGQSFIDQNSAKVPKYPFEVVFTATHVMQPGYRFNGVDFLVNRNSLRKLFDFCRGHRQESFRIDLSTVEDTLIMERYTKNTVEFFYGADQSGYGHSFEHTCTRLPEDLKDSTSHHRVLEYAFGDLRAAVRFEVDASYDHSVDNQQGKTANRQDEGPREMEESITSLSEGLKSLLLSPTSEQTDGLESSSVAVSHAGVGTDQTTTAEIKTGKKPINKILPQMWFGRTPYLIQGRHSKGSFDRIDISCMDKDLIEWENKFDNQLALRKIAALISELRSAVRNSKKKAAILIFRRDELDRIQLFQRRDEKKALPDWAVASFWTAKS